jgi:lytic murein transglycosylase
MPGLALRPFPRPFFALVAALLMLAAGPSPGWAAPNKIGAPAKAKHEAEGFSRFVASLWPQAQARGVSRATFDEAFRGITIDPKVVAQTEKQSEFVQPIWGYMASAVSAQRLARGRAAAAEWASALEGVERAYGVPRSVVLGIWGMESNFGAGTGGIDVIRALATLAFVRYRGDFFQGELLTALQILQEAPVRRAELRGSWAGAMGQTQFMPSSYVQFAVDGDGDGRRDIWTSVPDALASTANYLKQKGWQPGLPWGFEVELPEGFDFRNNRNDFSRWASLGLKRADGARMPGAGEATLLLPAGARGPALLVTANYDVIKSYNSSDAYALGVAHLGDRVRGAGPLVASWPTAEPLLGMPERREVQQRLAALGFYAGESDGKLGSKTRDAVRRFQIERGLVADGYADPALLNNLRAPR